MIKEVDNYLDVDCGRCSLVGTPQCKVKTWIEELVLLREILNETELKEAIYRLTPGRQKGYALYFSGAKQSATRASRIEKYIPAIMNGKGIHDR